ncbi:DUF5519 family protein [Pedobacter sp. SD-b]|uniref:DUF5519 family protein n=1 Tax=Pedobacter segetis TaxID=2793069 RepID=A0ABS1BH25_9SPHI|nr:luciferase family protein [Pedobacter segetis]MBK0381671.1 DUF5519 family protein [Pedobacter segetis]
MMTLEEKGPITPPPLMTAYPQMVSNAIQQWENVISATHWDLYDNTRVDGVDFYVGENELGHIHLDGSVHLATTNELRIPLIENNLSQKFLYGGAYDGWVLFKIATESDAKQAIWLFQLNYERLMGVSKETLISKINNLKKTTIGLINI